MRKEAVKSRTNSTVKNKVEGDNQLMKLLSDLHVYIH